MSDPAAIITPMGAAAQALAAPAAPPLASDPVLRDRERQVWRKGEQPFDLECEKKSRRAASRSARACSAASRVVLYPIADALHLVHGPIGCAAYTWDIRGALSSGPQLHRLSFSTDLRERDVVFGGENKLDRALTELIELHTARMPRSSTRPASSASSATTWRPSAGGSPPRRASRCIPVAVRGLQGHQEGRLRRGLRSACAAGRHRRRQRRRRRTAINILGDFNLAGEIWIIKELLRAHGRRGRGHAHRRRPRGRHPPRPRRQAQPRAVLRLHDARSPGICRTTYGIPFKHVSYFGIEDMAAALYDVARILRSDPSMHGARQRARARRGRRRSLPRLAEYRRDLQGKKAAIYVGGAFKAFSLV